MAVLKFNNLRCCTFLLLVAFCLVLNLKEVSAGDSSASNKVANLSKSKTTIVKPIEHMWPTMPVPPSSGDIGEAFIWDDYLVLFQVKPKTFEEVENPSVPSFIGYHYTVQVYDRKTTTFCTFPYPLLIVTMENDADNKDTTFWGQWDVEGRSTFGVEKKVFQQTEARNKLLGVVAGYFKLKTSPEYIGSFDSIKGHPKTLIPKSYKQCQTKK